MRSTARWYRFACTVLIPVLAALAATGAEGPVVPPLKMPGSVVVKAGTVVPSTPRPIAPSSFVVDVGKLALGARVPVELSVRNTSTEPIRIVGGNRGCSPQGCITVRGKYPLIIEPGGTGVMLIEYIMPHEPSPSANGHLELEANFYVAAKATFAVPYTIISAVAQ